jgi:hypothetical protein
MMSGRFSAFVRNTVNGATRRVATRRGPGRDAVGAVGTTAVLDHGPKPAPVALDEVLAGYANPEVERVCDVLDAWDLLIAERVPGADAEIVAVELAEMLQMDIADVLEITAVAGACRTN